jgi:DNA-binding transcriptional ArsR family regulator
MLSKEPGNLQETAREKYAPEMQADGDASFDSASPGSEPAEGAPISDTVAERLADTMFALSTPSRVLILGSLFDGPRSVSDLTQTLGMEQSAVSHQLRVLREHRLVRAERIGRRRLYALYDEHVRTLLRAGLDHVVRDRPAAKERARARRAAKGAW